MIICLAHHQYNDKVVVILAVDTLVEYQIIILVDGEYTKRESRQEN